MTTDRFPLLAGNRFIKLYEVFNSGEKHYVCASRHEPDELVAALSEDARKDALPDAVSCFVVLAVEGEEPKLVLNWEYRYPVGQYLLSVPAGLIDEGDKAACDPLALTAGRELGEECGISLEESDVVQIINPLVWSTPGLTDESNALVYVRLNRAKAPAFCQDGAEGTEDFDGVLLVDKQQARELLDSGRDPRGGRYPLFTWAALMYFLSCVE